MLDISKISKAVKIYGDSLYQESTIIGTVNKSEYELENGNTLKIPIGDGKFLYARIRASVLEAGIDFDNHVFTVQEFIAKRDASGETENGPWSVSTGEVKMFAY
jgi:hypothetical protein